MSRSYRYTLAIIITLAPPLMGASCESVDLGRSPDTGAAPLPDAAPPMPDAGAGDAADSDVTLPDARTMPVEARPYAREMLIDVFDGAESTLTFSLEVEVDDPTDAPHDVRPRRLELLGSDGSVALSYPLGGAPLSMVASRAGGQRYVSIEISVLPAVAPSLTSACASDAFASRTLSAPVRVVVEVDGVEHIREQSVPAGAGGFPPMRPFVLCHQAVGVTRTAPGFHDGYVGFRSRPDGLYDVEIWESFGAATYTSATVRDVDPEVRISPMNGRHFPSLFPPFSATMSVEPCASCILVTDAMARFVAGSPTPPLRIPSAMSPFWCAEPATGQDDAFGPWPPAAPGPGSWGCRRESGPITTGDGAGFVGFSGATDAGRFHVELFVPGGSWSLDETRF